MKKIIILMSVVLFSGCTSLAGIWPRDHDPAMFDRLVEVKIAVEKLNCTDKKWDDAFTKIEHLKVYTTLRGDPQAPSIRNLEEALKKAHLSNNPKFCDSLLNINKTRLEVVADAWKGR